VAAGEPLVGLALIHANQLHTIKIGRRRLVSRQALNECVKQLAKGAA
jgi:hypothetical protein